MSKFLHQDDNNDTKAIAILQVFLENSGAKNVLSQEVKICYPAVKG